MSIETDAGALRAEYVIVASQYPFLNRGGQFTQLKTRRTYGVAGVLPEGTTTGRLIVRSPGRSSSRRIAGRGLLSAVLVLQLRNTAAPGSR